MAEKDKPAHMTEGAHATFLMQEAIGQIEDSAALRFFMRSLLTNCGWATTPVASTAEQTFKLCGRHEIGTELISTMLIYSPTLYPNLIKEDRHENLSTIERDLEPYGDDFAGSGG
tara:strand:+ start:156 stop:500 length:345 start_codon:yes stop_codon:yes gene_type:complete